VNLPRADKICHASFVDEVARLRALGDLMGEQGWTELTLGDGTRIVRPQRAPAPPKLVPMTPRERDERAALSEEERVASAEEQAAEEHRRYWERVTRSSGAPIPPFRPTAKRSA